MSLLAISMVNTLLPSGAESGTSNGFTAIFEGNGYKIDNLYSRRSGNVGLFNLLSFGANIRNLAVTNAFVYGGGRSNVGILAGQSGAIIIASHSTGTVQNSGSFSNTIGGLVGQVSGGSITASYSTATVTSTSSSSRIGGLVGEVFGQIRASYSTGNVTGGTLGFNKIGGLVGRLYGSNSIDSSYSTGHANAGNGRSNMVGGLVGSTETIGTAPTIKASWSWGQTNGGGGIANSVGALVGSNYFRSTITDSYGYGSVTGNDVLPPGDNLPYTGDPPAAATHPKSLRPSNAGSSWTTTYWNFGGNTTDNPALKYNDYDGTGGVDYCSIFSSKVPGTRTSDPTAGTDLVCGTTFISIDGSGTTRPVGPGPPPWASTP